MPLTAEQKKLVENHMYVANRTARRFRNVPDAESEAYVALCHAARKWMEDAGPFEAYAQTTIRRHLCKQANAEKEHREHYPKAGENEKHHRLPMGMEPVKTLPAEPMQDERPEPIRNLPQHLQDIAFEHFVEDRPEREIAARYGTTRHQVQNAIKEAKAILSTKIAPPNPLI
jgi:RNA polymerase sigma factor (sigma-70 family)